MDLAKLTKKYHDLQDRGCTAFAEYESALRTLQSAQPGGDQNELVQEVRRHLHLASDFLQESLEVRQDAYHHRPVDGGHQRWEEKVQGWIDGNRDLDFELYEEHYYGSDSELHEQRRRLWVQFQEHLKALKATKRQKEEAETQFIKPITVDEPRRTDGTGQFPRVEWQTVREASDEILDTQESGQRISFTLPKKEEKRAWEPPGGFGWL